jgi:hypothetical protein
MPADCEPLLAAVSTDDDPFAPAPSWVRRPIEHARMLSEDAQRVLQRCTAFRPIDEHAARIVSAEPGLRDTAHVRQLLRALAESGWLSSADDFLRGLHRPRRPLAPTKGIVIRACDQPAEVATLLDSICDHHVLRDRSSRRVLLLDDSRHARCAALHARHLRRFETRTGIETRYVGSKEREEVVTTLGDVCPRAREALDWLIRARQRRTFGGGRSYNLALLLTAGGRFAMLDDDYRFPLRRTPSAQPGLDPTPFARSSVQFEPGMSAALTAGDPLAGDGLAVQLDLVGRTIGQWIVSGSDCAIDRASLYGRRPSLFAGLDPDRRIVATMIGVRGAAPTADSSWLYGVDEAARVTLWRDDATYRRHVNGDSLVLAHRRAVLRPFSMMTPFCLDNSVLMPSTAPSGRGEDALFGFLASYLHRDALTLHLPMTIGHAPQRQSPRYVRAMQAVTPGCNQFFRHWVRFHAAMPRESEPAARLVDLAGQLRALGESPAGERLRVLVEYLRYMRAERSDVLQRHLAVTPEAPDYWKADVQRMLDADAHALAADEPPRLAEWPTGLDEEACAEELRAACLQFAQALAEWPAVWGAARDLGDRLLPAD